MPSPRCTRHFRLFGIRCDSQIKFLTEAEHVHSSNDRYANQFEEFKTQLGMDCGY